MAGSRCRTRAVTSALAKSRSARLSSPAARTVSSSALPGPVPTKAARPGWAARLAAADPS